MTLSPSVLLRTRNTSEKFVQKIKIRILCSINPPPPKSAVYKKTWKNMVEPHKPQMTNARRMLTAQCTMYGFITLLIMHSHELIFKCDSPLWNKNSTEDRQPQLATATFTSFYFYMFRLLWKAFIRLYKKCTNKDYLSTTHEKGIF